MALNLKGFVISVKNSSSSLSGRPWAENTNWVLFDCKSPEVFTKDRVVLDYDERYFHGKPQNSFHKAVNIPDVVVCPRKDLSWKSQTGNHVYFPLSIVLWAEPLHCWWGPLGPPPLKYLRDAANFSPKIWLLYVVQSE
eukprot:Gb_19426 [translate_table: standard]